MEDIQEVPKKVKEPTINTFQVCNHFKIIEGNRRIIEKKYKGIKMTISKWEETLKTDNLLY